MAELLFGHLIWSSMETATRSRWPPPRASVAHSQQASRLRHLFFSRSTYVLHCHTEMDFEILNLPFEVINGILNQLTFTDLVGIRLVNSSMKERFDAFLSSIKAIALTQGNIPRPVQSPWVEDEMGRWNVKCTDANLVATLEFISKYVRRIEYLDAQLFDLSLESLIPMAQSLKYIRCSKILTRSTNLDATLVASCFPHLIDLEIWDSKVCIKELYHLYTSKRPGQFVSYFDRCRRHEQCNIEVPAHPVLGLSSDFHQRHSEKAFKDILLASLDCIQMIKIMSDLPIVIDSLKNRHLPALRKIDLSINGITLKEIASTLSASKNLQDVSLTLESSDMESRRSDEILFRSLLFDWPRLKELYHSYQSYGPIQDETDGEANHPIQIGSELVTLFFHPKMPIIFAGAEPMKLKHLTLSGPLDEKLTFSFPNLTHFSFSGPLSSQSLGAVLDGLHHSKSLESLSAIQKKSEHLDGTLAPRLLHFFSYGSLEKLFYRFLSTHLAANVQWRLA